jgi:hypothetical protein
MPRERGSQHRFNGGGYGCRNLWRYMHVIRTLYAICLVALIGSTAWAATEWKAERESTPGRVGFVLLTILQR